MLIEVVEVVEDEKVELGDIGVESCVNFEMLVVERCFNFEASGLLRSFSRKWRMELKGVVLKRHGYQEMSRGVLASRHRSEPLEQGVGNLFG